jgi:hypothetical protein
MKKQAATDAKKAAANDKPENGKAEKAKRVKPAEDAKYTVGNLATVKRGFLLALCEFVKAKGTVDHAAFVKQFDGRQFENRKVDAARITRYLAYCRKPRHPEGREMSSPLFPLGQVVVTPGAAAAFEASGDDPRSCIRYCVTDHRKRRIGTDGNRQRTDRPNAGRV